MRVYGRTTDVNGNKTWWVVTTDSAGFNDGVYLTALAQCLLMYTNESPFWADWGIPAKQSVIAQVAPDYAVSIMQQRFAQFFASLIITRRPGTLQNTRATPVPTYDVRVLTHRGSRISFQIPI